LQIYYHYFSWLGYKRDIGLFELKKVEQTIEKVIKLELPIFGRMASVLIARNNDPVVYYLVDALEKNIKSIQKREVCFVAAMLWECSDIQEYSDFKKKMVELALNVSGAQGFVINKVVSSFFSETEDGSSYYVMSGEPPLNCWHRLPSSDCDYLTYWNHWRYVSGEGLFENEFVVEKGAASSKTISATELFDAVYANLRKNSGDKEFDKNAYMMKMIMFFDLVGLTHEFVKYLKFVKYKKKLGN
jgi:hypothetical protein